LFLRPKDQLNVKKNKFKVNEFQIAILLVVYMHIIMTPFVSTIMYEHMGIFFKHDMDTHLVCIKNIYVKIKVVQIMS